MEESDNSGDEDMDWACSPEGTAQDESQDDSAYEQYEKLKSCKWKEMVRERNHWKGR